MLKGYLQLPFKLEQRGKGIPSGKVSRIGQALEGKGVHSTQTANAKALWPQDFGTHMQDL